MIGTVAFLALTDCIIYQMLQGRVNLVVAVAWLAAAVPPYVLCWLAVRARPFGSSPAMRLVEAAAASIAAATIVTAIDMLIFPKSEAVQPLEFLRRLRAELPVAVAVVAAGLFQRRQRAVAEPSCSPDSRLEILAAADLCRAAGNYVEATKGGRTILVRSSLTQAERYLTERGYVRVHRSVLVAKSAISKFENNRDGLASLQLRGGQRVKVGRAYRASLYPLRSRIEGSGGSSLSSGA